MQGRSGAFPMDCVVPVAAPDFLSLPAERRDEPRDRQGRVAASGAIALAVASTAAAHELDPSLEVYIHTSYIHYISMTRCLMADIMSIHYVMLDNDCKCGDNKSAEIKPLLIFENTNCEFSVF